MNRLAFHTIESRFWRLVRERALALSVALVAGISLVAALTAAAVGCTSSGFGIKGFSSAYTCIDVEGTPSGGLWVSLVHMSWSGAGTVCNWRFELRWTDVNGHVYRTDSSAVHTGCRAVSAVWEQELAARYSARPTAGTGAA